MTTTYTTPEQSIEEDVGNLAAVAVSLPHLLNRWRTAIRREESGDTEWADYIDVINSLCRKQLELTDRMLAEGLASVSTHKVIALLELGHIGINGDRPLACLWVDGKRVTP